MKIEYKIFWYQFERSVTACNQRSDALLRQFCFGETMSYQKAGKRWGGGWKGRGLCFLRKQTHKLQKKHKHCRLFATSLSNPHSLLCLLHLSLSTRYPFLFTSFLPLSPHRFNVFCLDYFATWALQSRLLLRVDFPNWVKTEVKVHKFEKPNL